MTTRPTKANRAPQYRSREYRELQSRLAANVRSARWSKGWTQEEAAHRCEMAVRLLQRVEAAEVNLTLTSLARLCEGLGVDAERLLRKAAAGRR